MEPGVVGQLLVGHHTDSGEHDVGRVGAAVGSSDPFCPVRAFDGGDRGAKDEAHTLLPVQLLEEAGHRFGSHAAHHPVLEFEHRDLAAPGGGGSRDFQPDVPGTDDRDPGSGNQEPLELEGVVPRPQRLHPGKASAGNRQGPGA